MTQEADTVVKPGSKHTFAHYLSKFAKIVFLTVMALILFVIGIVAGIYSDWFQVSLKEALVTRLNSNPDTQFNLGDFKLSFPLDLDISNLLMVSHGDTIIQAKSLTADVSLLPLLRGEAELKGAQLVDARYQIGALDSATCLVLAGKNIKVDQSTVKLSSMDIHVSTVDLDSARVSLFINPADTFPSTPSEPSQMSVIVDRVNYRHLQFDMQLMPSIYKLNTTIADGAIDNVAVNLLDQTVDIGSFGGNELNAVYLMPDSAQIANTTVIVAPDTVPPSPPWTIKIKNISMERSKALYTTFGATPLPGLDFDYIEVDNIDLNVTDFYNQKDVLRLPLKIKGDERCGISLDVKGAIDIDSKGISFDGFDLNTPTGTDIAFKGYLGTETQLTDPETPLSLWTDGKISVRDIDSMFPAFKPYLDGLRPGAEVVNNIDIGGTSGNLDIRKLYLHIDNHIQLAVTGNIENVFADSDLSGAVKIDGVISDVSNWTADILAGSGIVIPSMTLKGSASFGNDDYAADLVAITHQGKIALKGEFNGRKELYDIDIATQNFPVNLFLPAYDIGKVTATVQADGHGFDFFSPKTTVNANLDIKSIEYLNETYKDVALSANVGNYQAAIKVDSFNPGLDLHLDADGHIEGNKYFWDIALQSKDLNLFELGLSDESASVSADLRLKADISRNLRDIDAMLSVREVEYITPDQEISLDHSRLILSTTDSLTNLTAQNRDLYAFYSSPLPLDSIAERLSLTQKVLENQFKNKKIDIPQLQRSIMPFTIDIEGGNNNALAELLAEDDIRFERLSIMAANDTSLYLSANIQDFSMKDFKLDDVSLDIHQLGDRLNYLAKVDNRPGTLDQWAHVVVDGYFQTGQLGINIEQKDIENKTGIDLGATLTLNRDSTMTLHLEPYTPIINYRKWELNKDNFVKFDFRHYHLDADLKMKSDMSQIALYTEHATENDEHLHGSDEDLILQLYDIQIQDWMTLDPFAPPIKGNLSAGVRLNWEDASLNGKGTVDLTDLYYGKDKIGDFNLDLDLLTDRTGKISTQADLWINNEKSFILTGALNDSTSTSPFNLDLEMIQLPLSVANPFISDMAKLNGVLKGKMDVKGNMSQPVLNGYLAFEDASVNVNMIGSTFTLNKDTIPVKDNLIRLNNFKIFGQNENPLAINGTVDINSISDPQIKLDLSANNMQLVNTNRAPKGAEVYGKAFVGLTSSVKGNLDFMNINANVNLMPGTNVTYILAGGTAALESQANTNMVKFVNFADTAAVAAADSIKMEGMLMNLNANLNIQTGTIINVDLGSNVQDRVQLQGTGTLNYVSSPVGSGRMTGRYTLSGGFVKYVPPLISNINFAFNQGSYVAFTGDLMNPQFNISAFEQMRANVSQPGQNSRLIYFDIIVSLTGSLENFKLNFNLATDDDVTIANELASMSPTQRESEAINLLLYNTYTGGSTKATSNLNGNPLFAFLTNSVNSWLANNIRAVDLSIGVNQYDQTTNGSTSTTTSYSYQVSKSLLNDRIKIIVGGSYSDDPAENGSVAENLINDISFEYFLNNARTMYIKLFRHTGFESILEGEITQTGVGFVYKKRISRISDMFIPRRKRRKKTNKDTLPQSSESSLKPEGIETPGDSQNTAKPATNTDNEITQPK